MTEIIKTYAPGTNEYARLSAVAAALTATSKHGRTYKVEDVYFDFGQNWMWTTISYEGDWGGVQILNPREFEDILTRDDLGNVIEEIKKGAYFND